MIIISDWYIFVGRLVLSLFHGVHASLWQVQRQLLPERIRNFLK